MRPGHRRGEGVRGDLRGRRGAWPALSFLGNGHGLPISERNTILADPETLATARPGVFEEMALKEARRGLRCDLR